MVRTVGLVVATWCGLLMTASGAEAQLISGIWGDMFSPGYTTYYGTGYRTSFYAPTTYTSYFSPAYTSTAYYGYTPSYVSYGLSSPSYANYTSSTCCDPCGSSCAISCDPCKPCRSVCDPCGIPSCSPCGFAGSSSCPGGQCGSGIVIPSERADIQPIPADGSPRTYEEEPPLEAEPLDDGFRSREEGAEPLPAEPGRTDAFKIVPKKQPAPVAEPKIEDPIGPEALNLDTRFTSRSAPQRTRLTIRAEYTMPVVHRHMTPAEQGWTPIDLPTQLAAK